MWYVMQVRTGTEERIRLQCERVIEKAVLERCFIPHYQQKKRFQGKWHIQEKILFPGYVFLIARNVELVREKLQKVIGLTKLIGTGDEIIPLTDQETALLLRMGGEEQVVEISVGVIEKDKVKIQEGPLVGMEGLIKKIDRHKRLAYLEVEMLGRTTTVKLGLEIVAKHC